MANTSISWSNVVWNPSSGCSHVSEGCRFCYAEVMSKRLKGMGQVKYKNGFSFAMHESALNLPFSWKKPKLVFVNSMSDLFHRNMHRDFLLRIFEVMNKTPQHQYQVLTKRPENLLKYDSEITWTDNIWAGVSVESTDVIDRIDLLRQSSAKTKFLSCEPLLSALPDMNLSGIDWVIVGGESGSKFRPMDNAWATDIQQQCEANNIAFFFKQHSGIHPKKLGNLLNDKVYEEFPIIRKTV